MLWTAPWWYWLNTLGLEEEGIHKMNVGKLNRTLFFLGFLGTCEKMIRLPHFQGLTLFLKPVLSSWHFSCCLGRILFLLVHRDCHLLMGFSMGTFEMFLKSLLPWTQCYEMLCPHMGVVLWVTQWPGSEQTCGSWPGWLALASVCSRQEWRDGSKREGGFCTLWGHCHDLLKKPEGKASLISLQSGVESEQRYGNYGEALLHSSRHWCLKIDICPIPEATLDQKAASGCCQASVSCVNSFVFSGSLSYLPLASKLPVVLCGKRAGRQNPQVGHWVGRLCSSKGQLWWQSWVFCVSFVLAKHQALSRASGQEIRVRWKWTVGKAISWVFPAKWIRKDSNML